MSRPARAARRLGVIAAFGVSTAFLIGALQPVSAQQGPLAVGEASASTQTLPLAENDPLIRLNRELESNPDSLLLRFERAKLLEERGWSDAALRDYRWVLNHRPELPEAYNNAARLLAARGELDEAIALLEQGMATAPVYQTMLFNLRAIYAALARRVYESALREPASAEEVVPLDDELGVSLAEVELTPVNSSTSHPASQSDTAVGSADSMDQNSATAGSSNPRLASRED